MWALKTHFQFDFKFQTCSLPEMTKLQSEVLLKTFQGLKSICFRTYLDGLFMYEMQHSSPFLKMLTIKKKFYTTDRILHTKCNMQLFQKLNKSRRTSLTESNFCKVPCKHSRNSTQNWTPPWMFFERIFRSFLISCSLQCH